MRKVKRWKLPLVLATIIMIRLTSNVSRLKMDAGKLFKESSLLQALNLVRGSAGRPKDFTNKRQCAAVTITTRLSSPHCYREIHVLMFRYQIRTKTKTHNVALYDYLFGPSVPWTLPRLPCFCQGFQWHFSDWRLIFFKTTNACHDPCQGESYWK